MKSPFDRQVRIAFCGTEFENVGKHMANYIIKMNRE